MTEIEPWKFLLHELGEYLLLEDDGNILLEWSKRKMVPKNLNCLFSTVKNTSGQRKVFGFLPPHGRTLMPNEEFTCFGNILEALGGQRGGRAESRRDHKAFYDSMAREDITIIQTPSPVLLDTSTAATTPPGTSYTLTAEGGALALSAPCWAPTPV